ncbi:hypothetical protein C7999DRAFT_16425 [Corynascus novoguineensis]|uniref:Uncharacterized protein n=1 Tax=Corynascus novoguineensis TaxID=1126955 RepID=A0AAN7HKY2_9PEZI|nr:hypothetical protein C7999DRAFT_16425 [Corynascus novoguineensis]
MSSKNDGKEKAYAQDWGLTERETREPLSSSKSPRSITPKGPIFLNLGEAHQAITSRLVSRSTANHPPATAPQPRYFTPYPASAATGVERAKTPIESSPVVSGFELSSASNFVGDCLNEDDKSDPASLATSEAGHSTKDLHTQCCEHSLHVESSVNKRRTQAVCGSGLVDAHLSDSEESHSCTTSKESQLSMPEPGCERMRQSNSVESSFSDSRNFSWPVSRVPSVPDFYRPVTAFNSPHQVSRLELISTNLAASNHSTPGQSISSNADSEPAIYGRLPYWHDSDNIPSQDYEEADDGHRVVSYDASTDSDEDPFQYDRGSFTVFLQPGRERDVSAALRRMSTRSAASVSGDIEYSSCPKPNTPRVGQTTNPFANRLQFYQASTVNHGWDDQKVPREVGNSARPPAAPPNSPVEPAFGLSEYVEEPGSGCRRQDVNTPMNDDADWETIATSVGRFGSNNALASSGGMSNSHHVKVAGSSIADYSDTSSVHVPHFDASMSTERILLQPSLRYMNTFSAPRALDDSGHPFFSPKPRIHRFNSYLQNSRRMFTDTTTGTGATSARSALVEKLRASIRSRSARKSVQRCDQYLDNPLFGLGFDSTGSISSIYSDQVGVTESAPVARSAHEGKSTPISVNENTSGIVVVQHENKGKQIQEMDKGLLASTFPGKPPAAHVNDQHPTKLSRSPGPMDSSTLFAFPLISLEEAARRATTRIQDKDNFTVTSGVRSRKNSSTVSSKGTQRTSPPTPHIMEPKPAYARRPTSADILGIRAVHDGSSVYLQDRIALGHDNVTFYKSRVPFVHRRSALSRTFNPMADSSALRSAFPEGHQSIFDIPPRLIAHDQRNTTMKNMMANLHRVSTAMKTTRSRTDTNASSGKGRYAPQPCDSGNDRYFFPTDCANAEDYLSWEARWRRRILYFAMCGLCIFPFIAPLVYKGTFDSALSWYTRGETGSLTRRQRRNVLAVGVAFSGMWLIVLTVFITIVVNRRMG